MSQHLSKKASALRKSCLIAAAILFCLLALGSVTNVANATEQNREQNNAKYKAEGKAGAGKTITLLHINDVISPPIAKLIKENISESATQGAQALIIVLDTPGGLELAMRDIIKDILNAPLPVIVFIAPAGARAASAGALIATSAHIAAMAPGTNIGAAHPVSIGIGGDDQVLIQKAQNDMVAYAQSIAKIRGRNATWIEQAISNSSSITADKAKTKAVVDVIAINVDDLLNKIDGMQVTTTTGGVTLATHDVKVVEKNTAMHYRVLAAISNPNIAYILFLIGLVGLYFEFYNPGVIFPGVVGGISLLLACFSMQTLPVSFAGVALIILAIIFFIMEITVLSSGILAIGGIIALLLGSLMLFESPEPALRVSAIVFIPALALVTLFFITIIHLTLKAQRRKNVTGAEGMVGKTGRSVEEIAGKGMVLVDGEYWQAYTAENIPANSEITVVAVVGLELKVEQK